MIVSDLFSISSWKKPGRQSLTKTLALLIVFSFVLPGLTWAFSSTANPLTSPAVALRPPAISIPAKLGTITQSFLGGDKTIIFIQDLHCNYEVQKNIAGIIDRAAKEYGVETVGVEGAWLPVHVEQLAQVPLAWAREEIGDYLLKAGKITGSEWLAATGQKKLDLAGIEDETMYASSLKQAQSLLNSESQGCLLDLREGLQAAQDQVYSPELLALEKSKRAFREGKLSLLQYALKLRKRAGSQGLGLEGFPNLAQYLSLNRDNLDERVDADGLFRELEVLEQTLRQSMLRTQAQSELSGVEDRLNRLERVLNISATQEDLADVEKNTGEYSVAALSGTIQTAARSEAGSLDPEVSALDEYLSQARAFYGLADRRSQVFVEKLLRRMEQRKTSIAVMVTGGFHTDKIQAEFKARRISYVCVRPKITHQDVANPYFDLLRNRPTPLDKLLEKTQNILAVATNFRQGETAVQIKLSQQSRNVLKLEKTIEILSGVMKAIEKNVQPRVSNPKLAVLLQQLKENPEAPLIVEMGKLSAVLFRPGTQVPFTGIRPVEIQTMRGWQVAFLETQTLMEQQGQLVGAGRYSLKAFSRMLRTSFREKYGPLALKFWQGVGNQVENSYQQFLSFWNNHGNLSAALKVVAALILPGA
ncbi:MAG: hypothetical protein HGA76_11705, partial [Candidatus Firestonebacteria bacterium]|nr:hypothetical protein [Candidatus Firestonebacteria bacterium]